MNGSVLDGGIKTGTAGQAVQAGLAGHAAQVGGVAGLGKQDGGVSDCGMLGSGGSVLGKLDGGMKTGTAEQAVQAGQDGQAAHGGGVPGLEKLPLPYPVQDSTSAKHPPLPLRHLGNLLKENGLEIEKTRNVYRNKEAQNMNPFETFKKEEADEEERRSQSNRRRRR